MAMRDHEDGEFDADTGEMLGYLRFGRRRRDVVRRLRRRAQFLPRLRRGYRPLGVRSAGTERFGDTTVTPVSVPRFWQADLPRSFIVCEQDRSMPCWLADPPAGSVSSSCPSTRRTRCSWSWSHELAELLVHATTTRPVGPLIPD